MSETTSTRGQGLLVLGKISAILDAFTLRQPELSLTEIRQRTGLPVSTAQRLVANLVDQGFLDRSENGYRVGLRMSHWAAPALQGTEPVDIVKPVLESTRDELDETVAFYRESAQQRVCIALAETRQILRRAMRVGQILPVHAGSAGRVILAWTPGLLERITDAELSPLTAETITDIDALRTVVSETQEAGYAITVGERQSGSSGLSAPVFNPQADLFGVLTIMGPSSRMPRERCEELVPYLLEQAEHLTRTLGGRHPDEE